MTHIMGHTMHYRCMIITLQPGYSILLLDRKRAKGEMSSDNFWTEAINATCHVSNRLYCHRLLKKTPYKLLIRRKMNISYFWILGVKCYILTKGTWLSVWKNVQWEFLLGYSSNNKAYQVCKKTQDIVEEVHDVRVDETNGSQIE